MRAVIAGAVTIFLVLAANAAPLVVRPGMQTGPAKGAAKLPPDDIKATFFNGQAFTASTPAGIKFKMLFTADGKVTREPAGKSGAKGEGIWALSKDGFCTTWKGSKKNCYRLFATGENNWSVSNGGSTLATWSK